MVSLPREYCGVAEGLCALQATVVRIEGTLHLTLIFIRFVLLECPRPVVLFA